MKVEIDLMDNGITYESQFEAVNNYMDKYGKKAKSWGVLGMYWEGFTSIEETPKDTGFRIETSHRNFHVSCRKTKGGTYKFKVWQAV